MRTIVFGSLLLFVLQACGNASSPEYESGDGTARHVSIAYLKSLCRGVLHPVTEDLWIEGCVVGNDLYGEFPDALVVEDESGGIEVFDRREASLSDFRLWKYGARLLQWAGAG